MIPTVQRIGTLATNPMISRTTPRMIMRHLVNSRVVELLTHYLWAWVDQCQMSQLGLTARNLTAHGPSLPGARVFPPGNRTFVLVSPPARPHRRAARRSPALRRRRLLRQGPGGD